MSAGQPDPLLPTAEAASAEWARRVRAHNEAPARVGLARSRDERWSSAVEAFTADPGRRDEPALEVLRALVRPGETWLDIGAGAGRYALPLALVGANVVAVEPSKSMSDALRAGLATHGIRNVTVIDEAWPMPRPPAVDVAFIAHVGYGSEEIGPFLDAMEESARRLCVAVMFPEAPSAAADPFWAAVHGVERESLPALREFLVLQIARRRPFELRLVPRHPAVAPDAAADLRFLRNHLRVEPGTPADLRLQQAIANLGADAALIERRSPVGIVTWDPAPSLTAG